MFSPSLYKWTKFKSMHVKITVYYSKLTTTSDLKPAVAAVLYSCAFLLACASSPTQRLLITEWGTGIETRSTCSKSSCPFCMEPTDSERTVVLSVASTRVQDASKSGPWLVQAPSLGHSSVTSLHRTLRCQLMSP